MITYKMVSIQNDPQAFEMECQRLLNDPDVAWTPLGGVSISTILHPTYGTEYYYAQAFTRETIWPRT